MGCGSSQISDPAGDARETFPPRPVAPLLPFSSLSLLLISASVLPVGFHAGHKEIELQLKADRQQARNEVKVRITLALTLGMSELG